MGFDDLTTAEHLKQAVTNLPGPDYYQHLREIHSILRPRTYIEIGIRRGESMRQAESETHCIGIDPEPAIEDSPDNLQVFRETSDQFFSRPNVTDILGSQDVDLAFIDGLHLWEQALRDFVNIEQLSSSRSVVLLHDCIPLNEVTSARQRTTGFYSGDVWKLTACLCVNRPDLDMALIPTPPTGLCLVRRLDRYSRKLHESLEELETLWTPTTLSDLAKHPEWMPTKVSNSFDAVAQWLRS